MKVRVNLSILIIFLGLLTVESRRCFSLLSDLYRECPGGVPKCCGIGQNTCARTCEGFKCEKNDDCDGFICCGGECAKSCSPVSTWAVVGIAVVCLFILLTVFRACQWCRKRKVCTQQDQAPHEPPFVVSDFDNHGFMTSVAPPAYDSVVQNTGSRTGCDPPVYSLNLQTMLNNSSRNDPASNNFEVNISIRGSTMLADDFPPSYNEISNSSDDNVQPTLYTSSQGEGVENSEERRLRLSYSDEPPPYSLSEESTTEESPNNTTRESNIDENFSHDNTLCEELRNNLVSVSHVIEQLSDDHSNIHETGFGSCECRYETSNDEQSCCNVNQETSLSNVLNNLNPTVYCAVSESTTHF